MTHRIITVEEIAEKLQYHYDRRRWNERRPLYIHKCRDNYENIGSVYFSLEGSPPKGFAVYILGRYLLSFYDIRGRRWQILHEATVEGLDVFKDTDILIGSTRFTPDEIVEESMKK